MVGALASIPKMMGILTGTNDEVLAFHMITLLSSGLILAAQMILLYLNSANSFAVNVAIPLASARSLIIF